MAANLIEKLRLRRTVPNRVAVPTVVLAVSLFLAGAWWMTPPPEEMPTDAAMPQLLHSDVFLALLDPSPQRRAPAEALVRQAIPLPDAQDGDARTSQYAAMLIEVTRFSQGKAHYTAMMALLEELTGENFPEGLDGAYRWLWARDYQPHPNYAAFKARLYSPLDPRFAAYFDDHTDNATIRRDEVRWGGVRRDGIPPLKNPEMVAADAEAAGYLEDDNVVFGIVVNGDARAYPKRILAWHEMFKDTIGGVSVNGVYCTLCGSMILYETEHNGTHHELGTSGFLYRSNKLMYDQATESMWSTITGKPVIGPLVGQGIKLKPLYVVTTTWGQWRETHPDTAVLSLNTGSQRDYREGAAYRDYLSNDRLMFTVPKLDTRLKNKAEVLALRFGGPEAKPLAIAADYLVERPIYHGEHSGARYVVLTDPSGANRVYAADDVTFETTAGPMAVQDTAGAHWQMKEDALHGPNGQKLQRLPAHRAFWFGWHAAHPETELIH